MLYPAMHYVASIPVVYKKAENPFYFLEVNTLNSLHSFFWWSPPQIKNSF